MTEMQARERTSQTIPTTMRAIVQDRYGAPELVLSEHVVPVPAVQAAQVLVKVAACAVNALDWHYTTGEPMFARLTLGLRRPDRRTPGNDIAGVVAAVGPEATQWKVGDHVVGSGNGGGFAEYVLAKESWLVARPTTLGVEEAAGLGVAATTALQGLRDWGGLVAGQSVLINGASGGVGTFAIQLAKILGASHVTAVCSTRNCSTAADLGADEVIDYTTTDVAGLERRFDLFLDNAGSTTIRQAKRLLVGGGTYVMVTAPKSRWVHPLPRMLATPAVFATGGKKAVVGKVARTTAQDTGYLVGLSASGRLRTVIEARYPLTDGPEVIRVQGEFHARGKTVVIP